MSGGIREAIDFTLDLETNRVPAGIGKVPMRNSDGSIVANHNLSMAEAEIEKHVVPSQVAYIDHAKSKMTVVTVDNLHTPKLDLDIRRTYDISDVFKGNKVDAKIHAAQVQTREDINKLFMQKNSKGSNLTSRQKDYFFDKIYPHIKAHSERSEVFYEQSLAKQRQLVYSSFSKKYFTDEASTIHTKSVNSVANRIDIDATKSGVWEWETFKNNFVNEFAGTIIDAANKRGAVNIGAWNAQFESDRLAGWIHNYADPKIKQQWINLVKGDKIKFVGMETSYLDVLWGLSKKDKGIINSSRIPLNESAFQEFGYRAGATPRTYQEFTSAVSWSQDRVVEATESWLTSLKGMTGEAGHFAPIDTVRADSIKTFFDKVQDKAVSLAREREALTPGMVDHSTIMHEAFEHVVVGEGYAPASQGSKVVDNFIETVIKQNKNKSRATENVLSAISRSKALPGGGGFSGGSGGGNVIEDIVGGFKGKNFWRYGTIAAAAGLAVAATYFETSDFGSTKMGNSFGKIGRVRPNGGIAQFDDFEDTEDGPYINSHFEKALLWTGLSAGALGLVGLREANLRSPLFGVTDKFNFKTSTATEKAVQAGKLIRTGINVVESNFPITRVFKAGAALKYLGDIGKKKGVTNSTGGITRKVLSVPLHNIHEPSTVGTVNIDSFIDYAMKTNKVEATQLRNLMNNKSRLDTLKKSTIVMQRTENGKTIVRVVDITNSKHPISSNPIFGEQGFEFDVDVAFGKTRTANLSGRGIHPSKRRGNDKYNPLRNSLVEDRLASEQTRVGLSRQLAFDEFFAQFKKPAYMNEEIFRGYKYMQYLLNIGPKGIHLGNDIFTDNKNSLGKVKTFVGVKGVSSSLEGMSMLNAKAKFLHYSQFGTEFLQAGNRFLESPFEMMINPQLIEKTIHSLQGSNSLVKNIAGNILGKIDSAHLGLNINHMKYGSLEYIAKFALKRVLPLGIAYYGVKTADSLLGAATFSPTGRGPITAIPNKIYQTGMLAYSKVSDILGLTSVAKSQEKIAPGSTGLGIFAFPAAMAGTYSLANMIYGKAPVHAQGLINKFGQAAMSGNTSGYRSNSLVGALASKFNKNSIVQEALRIEAFPGALNKSFGARAVSSLLKNPKKTIFTAAAALMLPFLPGAIGSNKSYDERRAEYRGERDVAIRKNRGWLLSGSPFVGGAVSQYRQHGSYIYNSNYENRGVIWPSYKSKLLHAATFGLANRYVLEEYHKESQPVYETSPYGASVPVIGPLISQTVGRLLKPVKRMHEGFTGGTYALSSNDNYSDNYKYIAQKASAEFLQLGTASTYNVSTGKNSTLLNTDNVKSENSTRQAMAQLRNQVVDLVGFKGFALETVIRGITGTKRPDEYTPYLKSAQQMYNPAQQMWQYDAGDFSLIGGEFFRRGLVSPRKMWEINDIPNELYGQKWIPKKFHQGTTFDKMPMGWLYASRKGWEFTHPEIKGLPMEQYPDEIKLDILKYMAPQSAQFSEHLKRSTQNAVENKLTPFQEQRVYDAAEQAAEIKKRVWATKREEQYRLDMEEISGRITSIDTNSMTFTVDEFGDKRFRIAGVTSAESNIRAGLLKSKKYTSAEDLSEDALSIQSDIISKVQSTMKVGSNIDFSIPDNGNISGGQTEALIGSLNKQLLAAGSPLHDTGNVSQYNMTQDSHAVGSSLLSSYWDTLTDSNNLFKNKLMGSRDYITKYESDRVLGMPVKLWSRPIEHFLKPLIASALDNIGIHMTPSFTKERRKNEQYWDVIKYIKYKTLATKAEYGNDEEAAEHYRQLASKTMVGADPINDPASTKAALPAGDKDYFDFFSNEPDKNRRSKILGLISSPQKRIYNAIWTSKVANSGRASKSELEMLSRLKDTGGYDVDDSVISDWKKDAGEQSSLKDYVRARYIGEFAKHNKLPGSDWIGYDERVNIDNVELMHLDDTGFQVEDYGYFDEQKRSAAFDKMAYISNQTINSSRLSQSQFIGDMLPALVSNTGIGGATGMPTSSQFPIQSQLIESDNRDNQRDKRHTMPTYAYGAIDDTFLAGSRLLRI